MFRKVNEVLDNPLEYAKQLKSDRRYRVIGTFLPDVPEELIDASGAFSFMLLGGGKSRHLGSNIPDFACSLIISTFTQASLKELDFLDGVVIPHCCDSSRSLLQIWERNFPKQFSHLLRLPLKLNSQGTKIYLIKELTRFKETIERVLGVHISNEALRESIGIYNENRRFLREIHALRFKDPQFISNYQFFSLVKSSMLMPKREHNGMLQHILSSKVKSYFRGTCFDSPQKIFVSGILAEPLEIFQWMDEMGIFVADDDLAAGSRYFSYRINEEDDPLRALAESYFHRIHNPLVQGGEDRLNYILTRVKKNSLQGVVFIHLKFCDPLIYDYPDLKKALDREGIPNLLIETELHTLATAQIKTRLQAFSEILRGNE